MIHAVLFDLEGTLVDFQWNLSAGEKELRTTLAAFGLTGPSFTADYAGMWNRAATMAPREIWPQLQERLTAVYDRYDDDALTRWSLRPGARELLSFLRENAKAAGMVTNVGRQAVLKVLDRFGLGDCFAVLVTRNDVTLVKPEGEGIKKCLEGLHVNRDQALFVGDSRTDILASRAAGLRVAAVSGGETKAPGLMAAGPDYLLFSLVELRDLLTRSPGLETRV